MKAPPALLIAGLLSIVFSSGATAVEPVWTVKVEVQMVAVTPLDALELIPELREERSMESAFQKLQRMIANEEAEVLGWPVAVARSGTRSVAETSEEVRYATEPDLHYLSEARTPVGPSLHLDRLAMRGGRGWGVTTPSAFETRNSGQTLEVEPVVEENGERVALSITAQRLRLVKFHELRGEEAMNGIQGVMVQPEFSCYKFTGSLTVRSGRWMLLSSSVEQQPKPRVILFLLRAVTMRGASEKPIQ